MDRAEFDAAETIGGFSLVSTKRALCWVGLMDDRDDVANVAEALSCGRSQAERVLTALERRGLVTPTTVKNQWRTTPQGGRLAYQWKPPPRLEPAIAFEEAEKSDAINEVFDDVPCSILRPTPDEDDAFEEANLQIGVFVDYVSPRVIEMSVVVPDDYDHRDGGGAIESSIYVGVEDAKRFAKALQTAIERAESELARRATAKPRVEASPARAGGVSTASPKHGTRATAMAEERTPPQVEKTPPAERALSAAERTDEDATGKKRERARRALDATLQEPAGQSKRRRKGSSA